MHTSLAERQLYISELSAELGSEVLNLRVIQQLNAGVESFDETLSDVTESMINFCLSTHSDVGSLEGDVQVRLKDAASSAFDKVSSVMSTLKSKVFGESDRAVKASSDVHSALNGLEKHVKGLPEGSKVKLQGAMAKDLPDPQKIDGTKNVSFIAGSKKVEFNAKKMNSKMTTVKENKKTVLLTKKEALKEIVARREKIKKAEKYHTEAISAAEKNPSNESIQKSSFNIRLVYGILTFMTLVAIVAFCFFVPIIFMIPAVIIGSIAAEADGYQSIYDAARHKIRKLLTGSEVY